MTAARVALATCAHHDGFVAGDDEALASRLGPMGFAVERPRWDDSSVDWGGFDAVLIRTTWDYQERLGEFLGWAGRVAGLTRLFNPVEVVRANLDKRYMREIERAGVAIVPTAWIERADGSGGGAEGVRGALGRLGARAGVIKPVVGAGASGLLVFDEDGVEAAGAHADGQIAAHGGVLVQPLLESVRTRGELSVVLIDGRYSHAVRKTPRDGEWRVQIEFGGRYEVEDAGAAERRVAEGAVAALCGAEAPLYARIDLVEVDGRGPSVIEAELVEPELFFPWSAEGGDRLGRALAGRLGVAVRSGV